MKRARRWLLSTLVLVVVTSSCAPAAAGNRTSRNPDLITADEIAETNYATAYEIVQRLRPQWLRARSAPSFSGNFTVSVYLDNVRFGEIDSLRTIPAPNVLRMEWVDAGTATQRWGTGNAGGAVAVTTRRG